jgi:hypothetical protein
MFVGEIHLELHIVLRWNQGPRFQSFTLRWCCSGPCHLPIVVLVGDITWLQVEGLETSTQPTLQAVDIVGLCRGSTRLSTVLQRNHTLTQPQHVCVHFHNLI